MYTGDTATLTVSQVYELRSHVHAEDSYAYCMSVLLYGDC